jgi:3-deoxy-manno-octulosonate cytidylyltransferase (CMP-KDO synthetase)
MPFVDEVVVATDSPEVGEAVSGAGGFCMLTAERHPSGTDRVAEVAAHHEFAVHDTIVNVQGDEPFLAADAVAGAIAMVTDEGFAVGTAAAPASDAVCDDPNVVKVVCAADGRALYFSRAPIPWMRDPADRGLRAIHVRQHLGVYAYTREALRQWVALPVHPLEQIERLEQLRPLVAGIPVGVAMIGPVPEGSGGVDTEDDLARANARWNDLYAGRT